MKEQRKQKLKKQKLNSIYKISRINILPIILLSYYSFDWMWIAKFQRPVYIFVLFFDIFYDLFLTFVLFYPFMSGVSICLFQLSIGYEQNKVIYFIKMTKHRAAHISMRIENIKKERQFSAEDILAMIRDFGDKRFFQIEQHDSHCGKAEKQGFCFLSFDYVFFLVAFISSFLLLELHFFCFFFPLIFIVFLLLFLFPFYSFLCFV